MNELNLSQIKYVIEFHLGNKAKFKRKIMPQENQFVSNFEDNEEFDELSENQREHVIDNSPVDNGDIETPFSTKDVKITTTPITVSSIVNRLSHDEIDLQPDFQRKANLWDNKKMSRLVESILLKMPLPIFYFDVSDPDRWLVVDGLQRLSTIKRFIVEKNNKRQLKLGHMEFLTHLNGKTYDDLDRPFQRIIEETQLVTYQIEPQTPKEVRYSIFNRINTGGLSLNAQEIRQALNQKGCAVKFLKEVTEQADFTKIVNMSNERMLDRELALRFIAFKLSPKFEHLKTLVSFLDGAMEKLDEIKDQTVLDDLSSQLIETLLFSETLLGKGHKFSRAMANTPDKTISKTKTLNRSMFDVLTVCLSEIKNKEQFLLCKIQFKEAFIAILQDDNHPLTISINQGTGSKQAVSTRFKEMRKLITIVQHGC